MFSMTKSRELDEVQSRDADVNKRHFGEDVKFYPTLVPYITTLHYHYLHPLKALPLFSLPYTTTRYDRNEVYKIMHGLLTERIFIFNFKRTPFEDKEKTLKTGCLENLLF